MVLSRCVLLLMGFIFCCAFEEDYDPMVAFQCDRPSMYLTSSGWVKDETTGCLKDPSSILTFCQKSFPNLDIRNVVESTHQVTISNWCNFGEEECKHKFTTTPYRCLAGPFQSDALLVPEGCMFDHIHDSNFCTTLTEWSKTSAKNCQGRGMVQNSFSVLQPCGVNRFQGVEFVCCPPSGKTRSSPPPASLDKAVPLKSKEVTSPNKKVASPKEEKDHLASIEAKGPLKDYLKGENFLRSKKGGKIWNEHESYKKAREDMERIHHAIIAKMMKDWGVARQRVQELKTIDPKASEKLNKEVTSRFQKTYEAEELEAEMEKKQLVELHEQRIQAQLNEKKNLALDKYINAVEDEEAELMAIYRALEHYIKILQKERYHAVNKLKRIKAYHPTNVDEARAKTVVHLGVIDKQVKKALDMLRQVPKFETKITAMIKKNIDSLHSLDVIVFNHKDSRFHSTPSMTTSTTTSTTTTTTTKAADYFAYDTYSDDDDVDDDEYYDIEDESSDVDGGSNKSTTSPQSSTSKSKDVDEVRKLGRQSQGNKALAGDKRGGKSETKEYLGDEYYDNSEDKSFKVALIKSTDSDKMTTKAVSKVEKNARNEESSESVDDEGEDNIEDDLDGSNKSADDDDNSNGDDDDDESKSVDGRNNEEEDSSEDESSDESDDKKSHTTFNTAPTKTKTTSFIKLDKEGLSSKEHLNGESRKVATKVQQKVLEKQKEDQSKKVKYGGAGLVLEPQVDHHQGSPAHIAQDHLHAKQLRIEKSKKENKEFSSAIPLGLTVGMVTVAIVIVAGVLMMRRRSHRRQHRMIPTEPTPIDLVTSPEESHVTNMQVNGYENPTYKYFEMNTQN